MRFPTSWLLLAPTLTLITLTAGVVAAKQTRSQNLETCLSGRYPA
jgi:hypothetical protein